MQPPGCWAATPPWTCCPLLTSCLTRGQGGEVGVQALLGLGGVPAGPRCCCTGAGHKSITPKPRTTLSPARAWLHSALTANQPGPLPPSRLGANAPVPSTVSWSQGLGTVWLQPMGTEKNHSWLCPCDLYPAVRQKGIRCEM